MPSRPPPAAPADSPLATFLTTLRTFYVDNILPHLPTPLQTASDSLSPLLLAPFQSGDIVSLAAFLLAVYLTLRIADYIRRSIFSWIAFLIKIALLLVVVQVVLYAQRYGWEKTVRDATWLGGVVWGFLENAVNQASSSSSSSASSSSSRRRSGGDGGRWNLSGGRQQVPVGKGRRRQWR